MYQFTRSDIQKVINTTKFKKAASILYNISLSNNVSSGLDHVDSEVMDIITNTPSRDLSQLLSLRYPMSYFARTDSEAASINYHNESIQRCKDRIASYKVEIFDILDLPLKKAKRLDAKISYLSEDIQREINILRIYEARNPLQDIEDRSMFLSASTDSYDPAWWTWLHNCADHSFFITATILRILYPSILLYVVDFNAHTFLSNTNDSSIIQNLCDSTTLTRNIHQPLIFDMIQQVYIQNSSKATGLYRGNIRISDLTTSIKSYNTFIPASKEDEKLLDDIQQHINFVENN